MTERDDMALAKKVHKHVVVNPSATVQEIAEAVEAPEEDVVRVIDEHYVEGTSVTHRGPGQGGGWVPPEETEAESEA